MKSKYFIQAVVLLMLFVNFRIVVCQETREVRKTVEINKDGEVYIDTYKGSIKIDIWDNSQVDIYAKIEPDGWDGANKRKVRDTEIRIDDTPNQVRIITDYEKLESHSFCFFGLSGDYSNNLPFVHYSIKIPSTARLRIKDYKSESKISDLHSSIDLETYKGRVIIEKLDGSIDLETYKGDVRIDFAKLGGDARIETYKGTIDITLPQDAGFKLDADIGHKGDLHSDFKTLVKRRHHDDEQYQTTINGGGPLLRITTEKGDIRLRQK